MGIAARGGSAGTAVKASASPPGDFTLSELETALIAAVEDGRPFTPSSKDPGWQEGIRGKLIRAILLGTELSHHPRKPEGRKALKVRLTAYGIRIRPAAGGRPGPADIPLLRIEDSMDLSGLAAAGGGFLPPLELEGCCFANPVELSGVRLQSLTLSNCRFPLLRAREAKFDGCVTLADCGPRRAPMNIEENRCALEDLARMKRERAGADEYGFFAVRKAPPGEASGCRCAACSRQETFENCDVSCVVDFESAMVDGMLEIRACYLRAPPSNVMKQDPNIRASSAARLTLIRVRDKIEIVRSTFVGGASLVSAQVGNDIWIRGGKFLAQPDSYVLDFQSATVGGVLALQAAAADPREAAEAKRGIAVFPVIVIGHLTGINLTAGEVWIGEGFYYGLDKSRQGNLPGVNFAKANVARSFKVGAYHPQHVHDLKRPTGEARIHGEICLAAANLGKNLEMHGVGPGDIKERLSELDALNSLVGSWEAHHLKLRAHGLKVDRRVHLSHTHLCDAKPPAEPKDEDEEGESKEARPAALDFWKSTIGTGFRLGGGCSCDGAVRLNSCVIGRELNIACPRIESSEADRRADEFQPGDIPVALDISESTIMGQVKIGRRVPRSAVGNTAAEVEVTVKGALSLESSSIQGSLLLAHVQLDLSSTRDWEQRARDRDQARAPRKSHRSPQKVALNLRDCTCGSDLEVHQLSWLVPDTTSEEEPAGKADATSAGSYKDIGKNWHAIVDLRGMQCDLLVDGFGAQWGLTYRLQLRLAGIRIGDVEPPTHEGEHPTEGDPGAIRLEWLASQHSHQPAARYLAPPKEAGGQPASTEQPAIPPQPTAAVPSESGLSADWVWPKLKNVGSKSMGRLRAFGNALIRSSPAQWSVEWIRRVKRFRESSWARYHRSGEADFLPQTYDTFASAYRKAGEDKVAEAIIVEKKNVENVLRVSRLARQWYRHLPGHRLYRLDPWAYFDAVLLALIAIGGWTLVVWTKFLPDFGRDRLFAALVFGAAFLVVILWPFLVGIFHAIFRFGFRYGLSPGAALLSFGLLIGAGWVGVHTARNGGLAAVTDWEVAVRRGVLDEDIALVLDVDFEPTMPESPARKDQSSTKAVAANVRTAAPAARSRSDPPDRMIEGQAIHAQPSPCNLNVSSLLYALDVFLPLIDLDQERRCSVRDGDSRTGHDSYFGWRLAKTLYEIIGWIITSLVILTITGVLRRDLER